MYSPMRSTVTNTFLVCISIDRPEGISHSNVICSMCDLTPFFYLLLIYYLTHFVQASMSLTLQDVSRKTNKMKEKHKDVTHSANQAFIVHVETCEWPLSSPHHFNW